MNQKLEAIDEPMDVCVVEGEVAVLGPDGICGSFTAEAAEASGARLIKAAEQARQEDPTPSDLNI
jgi:hypothetical protein